MRRVLTYLTSVKIISPEKTTIVRSVLTKLFRANAVFCVPRVRIRRFLYEAWERRNLAVNGLSPICD